MYARALFEAAQDTGRLAEAHEDLTDFVASVRAVPELRRLLENPQLDPQAKRAALGDLLAGSGELLRNFVLLLVEKGREGEIEPIAAEFEVLVDRAQGRISVELTTAVELGDDDAGRIVGQIEQAAGRTVEATRKVDPALIGGIVLQAGSLRLDASVRGRLERLRHELVPKG